jgi:hypothetical protein
MVGEGSFQGTRGQQSGCDNAAIRVRDGSIQGFIGQQSGFERAAFEVRSPVLHRGNNRGQRANGWAEWLGAQRNRSKASNYDDGYIWYI